METLRQSLVLGFRLGKLERGIPIGTIPTYLISRSVAFAMSYRIGLRLAKMCLIEASCREAVGKTQTNGSEILKGMLEEMAWLERYLIRADLKFPELTPSDFQILRTGVRRIFK